MSFNAVEPSGGFDHPEEFILSKVSRLNFEGSGDVRGRRVGLKSSSHPY